jgi:hypothetical protein
MLVGTSVCAYCGKKKPPRQPLAEQGRWLQRQCGHADVRRPLDQLGPRQRSPPSYGSKRMSPRPRLAQGTLFRNPRCARHRRRRCLLGALLCRQNALKHLGNLRRNPGNHRRLGRGDRCGNSQSLLTVTELGNKKKEKSVQAKPGRDEK